MYTLGALALLACCALVSAYPVFEDDGGDSVVPAYQGVVVLVDPEEYADPPRRWHHRPHYGYGGGNSGASANSFSAGASFPYGGGFQTSGSSANAFGSGGGGWLKITAVPEEN